MYTQCTQCAVLFKLSFLYSEYIVCSLSLSLMHANPVTLAVCRSQCRNRGGALREGERGAGVRPNTHEMLWCPSKTSGKDTPTDPERKAGCGFQPRWHSQVPAQSATRATMERNYSTSTPSVSDNLMASSLARSKECTEKFSPRRSRSGTFDLKKMASSEK